MTRDLGAAWNGAILHCLEKDPSRRPQSAAAVVQELEAVTPVPARRRTRKWLVVAVVLASLLAAIVVGHRLRRPTAVSAVRARPVVAVLPLALEVPPSEAWIGPALSQMVYGQIEEDGGARLIPWWRVLAAYRSLALDTDQLLRPEQRQRVVELLPAQAFVEGQARCASPGNPDQCELRLELKQADGSSQLRTVKNFALGQAADALAGVGTQFREALGQPVRGPPPTAVPASQRPLAVMKAYGEGLTAYARFDFSAARASLEFAASLDPRDFDVQMALSHVLQRQGLFVRARKAAEAALGVAGPVPERHRTVEALLEWLGPDADRGIAAYRKLFEERPDDVELALLLSRRLPVKEALGVLNRVQDLSVPASADLLVNFQEALLTAEENDREKSRTLLASVQAQAERLKARRELSLVLGGSDWARAEALSRESGDRQRAAYLQLRRAADWQGEQLRAIGKGLWQGEQLRAIRESLSEFNAIRDATGAHQALVLTALYEDDWQRGRSRLDEALGKLAGTDEPPSFQYHLAAGFVSLRLGELEVARRSLELARVAARRPSLSLFVDIGADFEFPVDLGQLELEVLEQQDRLEEAEALAREQIRLARSAGNTTTEEFLCWSQCQRGKWREGAQCFEQLLAERPTHDRRFRDVAECYWGAGDIERAQRAATMTQNWRIMLATEVVNGEPVDPSIDLQGLLRRTLKGNDVIDRLRNELVLGTAELRYARTSPALFRGSRPLPNGHRLWASGRDRLERVLAEARRRHLPLLERQAREALAKEGQQSPSSHP